MKMKMKIIISLFLLAFTVTTNAQTSHISVKINDTDVVFLIDTPLTQKSVEQINSISKKMEAVLTGHNRPDSLQKKEETVILFVGIAKAEISKEQYDDLLDKRIIRLANIEKRLTNQIKVIEKRSPNNTGTPSGFSPAYSTGH